MAKGDVMRTALRAMVALAILGLLAVPGGVAVGADKEGAVNPFYEEWNTPYGMPPFDQIETAHFMPAIDRAIEEKTSEVEAIASSIEPATFANTIEALDRSGALVAKVTGVLMNLLGAETNDELQAIAREAMPRMTALNDDIYLNTKLFERVQSIWEARDSVDLTEEQARLLERTHTRFVRSGAQLDEEAQARLRVINEQLAMAGLQFSENLRKATNSYQLVIDDEKDLSGLPPAVVSAAAEAALAAGLDGQWVFTLQWPSLWPFLTYADNRELRREIYTAYLNRCSEGSEYDNTELIEQMVQLRLERANLLGYPTHAHYVLDDTMASTPEAVYDLLDKVWAPAIEVAQQEAADIQKMIAEEGHDFELEPWDWRYYAEKIRAERYALDETELRGYFQLENVRQGAFWLAKKLWGLELAELEDVPTYHPEVRVFEVNDADGAHIGVLLVDYHPRPGKRGGAWMNNYRDQRVINGRDVRPVICNVGNFSRPTGDQPALLSLDEVHTLFHEFGHALHGLLSRCRYQTVSGTSVARDFVELPSQIMENWVLEPEVLAQYARHYQTGEVIPDELVAKIERAKTFNTGYDTCEYLAASYLDMDWHTMREADDIDPAAFEQQTLERIGLPSAIPVRYRSPYFQHIFGPGGGYSAGYYSYLWAEVLDADAFAAFKETSLFDQATAEAFRNNVLARGGSAEPMELYVRFRGAEPAPEPMMQRKGLLAGSPQAE